MSLLIANNDNELLSVNPCNSIAQHGCCILVIGPTGSGKSSFIEAFSGATQKLKISKDQLASYTRNVTCYKIQNASYFTPNTRFARPVYLIDTPGFSDPDISEAKIMESIQSRMDAFKLSYIHQILYLYPITDGRVPMSKRWTIQMMKKVLGANVALGLTVVTTMWDKVPDRPEKKLAAERHLSQLGADAWKDFVDEGTQIVKFHNEKSSAIDIISSVVKRWDADGYQPLYDHPAAQHFLCSNLLDRIDTGRQEKRCLREDRVKLYNSTVPDGKQENWVIGNLNGVDKNLSQKVTDLVKFKYPLLPEFLSKKEEYLNQHLLDYVEEAREDIRALESALETQMDRKRQSMLKASLIGAKRRLANISKYLDESGNPHRSWSHEPNPVLALARASANPLHHRLEVAFSRACTVVFKQVKELKRLL